ncbi:Hypothetical predicted protein [Mytilus galloprovincialis]|uniref:Uncharacterized protein n=1 Tax=Mytilus galloprovincialis TaxID=29158 RepID=A0A8B6CYY8_MYTGA|nr:Hypothetical predicted protein [Mytilus galloprovincialis]
MAAGCNTQADTDEHFGQNIAREEKGSSNKKIEWFQNRLNDTCTMGWLYGLIPESLMLNSGMKILQGARKKGLRKSNAPKKD